MPTPLAREHHGDDHLEALQTIAAVSMAAVGTVLLVIAVGRSWSMPSRCCGEAGMRGLGSATAQPPTGARCAALVRCVRAAQLGGEWRTRATCAAHRQ
jgi:hypothetical protein